MWKQSLNGNWMFRQMGSQSWLPAAVPGGVHTDLMAAGQLPDPFVGDNEHRVQWVAESDWEYRKVFGVDGEIYNQENVFLVCEGLDTLADIYINGVSLGSAQNMFRLYRWDIHAFLQPGENELLIVFHSPVRYITARYEARPLPGVIEWMKGGQYLRKAPSHFGWDWGPHLPAIGIWKDIRLEAGRIGRLENVHIRQEHNGGGVTLAVTVTAEIWKNDIFSARLQLIHPGGEIQETSATLHGGKGRLTLTVRNPQLWWPNGYGAQPLYQVEVILFSGERQLDSKGFQIGLRTIRLHREPDRWGESFYFIVNDVPIFCKGSNWIPADSFPTRVTPERLQALISSAAAAHQNMLRVWGGGTYESETFYDLCDTYGILVWQDFMFACSIYPFDDSEMVENIHQEVIQNVQRLRYRACLALWCGNNEIDEGWSHWNWLRPDTVDLRTLDEQFFHHILPAWVSQEDPDHAYWPSSPSSGTPPDSPNSGFVGDIHQWDVWHGMKPFGNYRQTPARFVSEFGFQSLPALETIATYAQPEEWNLTSYVMEYHQRNPRGNGTIVTYLTNLFRLPKDFPSLVYLSQILQAEGMRIGVEHWRRERTRTGGTLYWQLNDCWPVASWSSIDYFGRWKALQYAAKRFYAPLLLSVEDFQDRMDLFLTNDTANNWQGLVRWSLETLRGEVLQSGERPVSVPTLATTPLESIALNDQAVEPRRDVVLISELWQGNEHLDMSATPLVPDKHLLLEDPGIQVDGFIQGGYLVFHLRSVSLARFVKVSLQGVEAHFSNNYFDLPPGRTLTTQCLLPQGWTVEQAIGSIQLVSLFDSY
jgi:beta-mannosidase